MEIDPDAGGEFPQVNTNSFVGSTITAYDWPSPKDLTTLEPRLDPAAKVTDVLSEATTSAFGFLIGSNVQRNLAKFDLMEHRLFDCPVAGDDPSLSSYQWLHLFDPDLVQRLDYERSVFVEIDYFDEVGSIEIHSFEHYQSLKAQDEDAEFGVELKHAVLSAGTPVYDMLAFLPFFGEVLVSKRLRDAFMKSHLTGLSFGDGLEVTYRT